MTSLITKLSIAAAATMLTLSPALADYRGYSHKHERSYGTSYDYKKRDSHHFNGRRHWRNERPYWASRYWKPRFYGWRYADRHHRHW